MAMEKVLEKEKAKCILALKYRKLTQESKVKRLADKAEMYELLKQKAQSAINLVGIFHPVFRSKTKVMITSADVQGSYYKKQNEIAKTELENINAQLKAILEDGVDFREVMRKKHAVQGSKVKVQGGVINFSNPKNARLTEGLFDDATRPTDNFKRLTQLCVDYPKSVATLPKETMQEIEEHKNYLGLVLEMYKLFGKKKRPDIIDEKPKKVDSRLEKMQKIEESKAPKMQEVKKDEDKELDIELDSIKPYKSSSSVDDYTKDLDPLNF